MSWLSCLNKILLGAGGLVATAFALLIFFQERLIYVPVVPGLTREYPYTPDRWGLEYEDVWLTASDGVKLHAWLIKCSNSESAPTVLFFQENAGNIAHRLQAIKYMMQQLRCNVFMLCYRGYGASGGVPSERGIRKDSQAALDHLVQRRDIDRGKIVVFGRSLGGAVGASLVARNQDKVAGLVMENTFTSILDMVGVALPPLHFAFGTRGFHPLNILVRSPWNTASAIGKVRVPILLLSGEADELVPPSHMTELYSLAKSNSAGNCRFVTFPEGAHMDTWIKGGERYWRVIRLFIQEHTSGNGKDVSETAGMNGPESSGP